MESQEAQESPEMIDRIVAAWLHMRGFKKSEKVFRTELHTETFDDYQGKYDQLYESSIQNLILFHEAVDNEGARYMECFAQLKAWVDQSLDRYKTELTSVLYPLFVHCVLGLLEKGLADDAAAFVAKFKAHAADHPDALNKLKTLLALAAQNADALQSVAETPEFADLRRQKIPVALSAYAFRLLFMWLLENKFLIILGILNAYVQIQVASAVPDVDGQDLRFFEHAQPSKPIMWGRLGSWIPRPVEGGGSAAVASAAASGAAEEGESAAKRAKAADDGDAGRVQVKSEIPLPPSLPIAVVEAQQEDAKVAASRVGKSLPR